MRFLDFFTRTDSRAMSARERTALDCDRWTIRRGVGMGQAWNYLNSTALIDKALAPPEAADARTFDERRADRNALAADMLDTLMSDVPLFKGEDTQPDPARAAWLDAAHRAPELAALRARTRHKPDIAAVAAHELALAYAGQVLEQRERESKGGGKGKGAGADPGEAAMAVRKASRAAEDAEQMKEAFGLSAGTESPNATQLDTTTILRLAEALRTLPDLRAIIERAGRFMARAAVLRTRKMEQEGMKMNGVELAGDLGRLLPLEAAKVAGCVPELELLSLMRLAQRQTLAYRRRDVEDKRGPMVISVDESGSMAGPNIIGAKALALAMVTQARAEGRPFALAAWSTGSPRVFKSTADAVADATALAGWLTTFQGGGTELSLPLDTIPHNYWPDWPGKGQADHIIITDDTVRAEKPLVTAYKRWCKERGGVRTYGFVIGSREADTMKPYCDAGAWAVRPGMNGESVGLDTVLAI